MPKLVTAYEYYRAAGTTGNDFQDALFRYYDECLKEGHTAEAERLKRDYSRSFTDAIHDLEPDSGEDVPHTNADAEREERIIDDLDSHSNFHSERI